jgi:hypothetical protein
MRRETQNPLISSQILCPFAEQSSLVEQWNLNLNLTEIGCRMQDAKYEKQNYRKNFQDINHVRPPLYILTRKLGPLIFLNTMYLQ